MKKYEPELGQAIFGQHWKQYDCPEWIISFLDTISKELERVMWNINQETWDDPFANTGNRFKNEAFEVQAYDWGDDEQPYNFKYKDIEISWYKYLGRGTTINRTVKPKEGIEMLNVCLESLRKQEQDELDELDKE